MLCFQFDRRITLFANLPFHIPVFLTFFLGSTHKVLKLGPEGFHRTELITHLSILLVDIISCPCAYAYRDDTLQISIQTVHVLKHLFHALLN
jgi:hypothetical protein